MSTKPSGYVLKENDLYQTPKWVTKALLRHIEVTRDSEKLDDDGNPKKVGLKIWEPANGMNAISSVLLEAGAQVVKTDKFRYTNYEPHSALMDFLEDPHPPIFFASGIADWIITNPPYGPGNKTAVDFIRKALEYVKRWNGQVAMLVTAKIDSGSTRYDIFGDCDWFRGELILTDRINWFPPSLKTLDKNGKWHGSTEDHKWCFWGPPNGQKPFKIYDGMTDDERDAFKAAIRDAQEKWKESQNKSEK